MGQIKRDECIIIIRTAVGGYSYSTFRSEWTPGDVDGEVVNKLLASRNYNFRRDGAVNTKGALKTELGKFIDEKFDVLEPGEVIDNTNVDRISTDP